MTRLSVVFLAIQLVLIGQVNSGGPLPTPSQPLSATQSQMLGLFMDSDSYCIGVPGQQPIINVVSNTNLVGKNLVWSYQYTSLSGVASPEILQGISGEMPMGPGYMGHWQMPSAPVSVPGIWTRYLSVEGYKVSTSYVVKNCDYYTVPPRAYITPETVTVSPGVIYTPLTMVTDRVFNPAITKQWRVTINGGEITDAVNNGEPRYYGIATPGVVPGAAITLPIPSIYFIPGLNLVTVYIELLDGTQFHGTGMVNALMRDALLIRALALPASTTPAQCSLAMTGNGYYTFQATGGNGAYAWFAPDGVTKSGFGQYFTTGFPMSGTSIVTLTSGAQVIQCTEVTHLGTVPIMLSVP